MRHFVLALALVALVWATAQGQVASPSTAGTIYAQPPLVEPQPVVGQPVGQPQTMKTDAAKLAATVDAGTIATVQKERIEALQELVKFCMQQFKHGTTPFDSVASAQEELINARLDATDKGDERVALLTEQLKVADSMLHYIDVRYRAAAGATRADFLRAKSHYLQVKIKLLQEGSRPVASNPRAALMPVAPAAAESANTRKRITPVPPLRPLGNKLMVDRNSIIWDGEKPVGTWGIERSEPPESQ